MLILTRDKPPRKWLHGKYVHYEHTDQTQAFTSLHVGHVLLEEAEAQLRPPTYITVPLAMQISLEISEDSLCPAVSGAWASQYEWLESTMPAGRGTCL